MKIYNKLFYYRNITRKKLLLEDMCKFENSSMIFDFDESAITWDNILHFMINVYSDLNKYSSKFIATTIENDMHIKIFSIGDAILFRNVAFVQMAWKHYRLRENI